MATSEPKYPYEIVKNEHDDSSEPKTKRVLLYGWDSDGLQKVRLAVDSSGHLQTDVLVAGGPLEEYAISDLDESGDTKYYGYTDSNGGYYILKLTATQARYTVGTSDYTTAWTNRESEEYDYFYNVFS